MILWCQNSKLTVLNISNCTKLKYLDCYNNKLSELDVKGMEYLEELYCYKNEITNLDISSATELTRLECYSNKLTSLDISNNKISISNNQLRGEIEFNVHDIDFKTNKTTYFHKRKASYEDFISSSNKEIGENTVDVLAEIITIKY